MSLLALSVVACTSPAVESRGGPLLVSRLTQVPAEIDTGQPLVANLPAESDSANRTGTLFGPYFDGQQRRQVWVRREAGAQFTELLVSELDGGVWVDRVLVGGITNPDRPAIHPDGTSVAFIAGLTGLASVWTMPFGGAADPVQQTNVGLHAVKRAPGARVVDFVPPPVDDSLQFHGDMLQWNGPDGVLSVRWR